MKLVDDIEVGEDEDFAKMFEESEKQNSKERIVTGTIVSINENGALVDVGQKVEGVVNIKEITKDGKCLFEKGDKIDVMIAPSSGERPSLSHKKVKQKKLVQEYFEKHGEAPEDLVVDVKVISVKRGAGFVLEDQDTLEFFMPMGLAYLKSEGAVGKRIKAKVLSVDTNKNSIIISRKAIVEERNAKKKEIIEKISLSDEPINGIVSKVVSFGLFIDIGGVDGLCYFKEISHKGPVKASDYYKEGDEVMVKVIEYNKEKDQIALSIKQCLPDPWVEIENELEKGDTIAVTVSNFESYGAFVDLGNDIEGLLHISEISWEKHLQKPQDVLSIGDEIEVEVMELNVESKRLRVSLKSLQPRPFDEFSKKFKPKEMVKGKIVSIASFGLFANIFPGVDGLIHNEDISWRDQIKQKEKYKKGDEVDVKILNIDYENKKVSLSIKATLESPLDEFIKTNKVGSIVTGTIKDFKDFGMFVLLTPSIDGLVRTEDFGPFEKDDAKIGDEVEAVITNIDTTRNKIKLSIKKLEYQRGKELLNQVNDDDTAKFGDVLRDKLKK